MTKDKINNDPLTKAQTQLGVKWGAEFSVIKLVCYNLIIS
jgi:hypothetical protein